MNYEKAYELANHSRYNKHFKSGVAYRIVGKGGVSEVFAHGGYSLTNVKKLSKLYHTKGIAERYLAQYVREFSVV